MASKFSENIAIVGRQNFPSPFIVDRLDLDPDLNPPRPESVVIVPDRYSSDHTSAIQEFAAVDLSGVKCVVLLSSTDIYNLSSAEMADESSTILPSSPWKVLEDQISDIVSHLTSIRLIILRLPLIVGTGMKGILAEIAAGIMGGTYRHILPAHSEARHSVIHASDIPEILPHLINSDAQGIYNLTDRRHPTTEQIAEAIAWRIDHKRIYSVPAKWQKPLARLARMIGWEAYSTARLSFLSTTFTYSDNRIQHEIPDFCPTSVTEYLKNHDYDNDRI